MVVLAPGGGGRIGTAPVGCNRVGLPGPAGHRLAGQVGAAQLAVFDHTSGYGGVLFILVAYVMLLVIWLGAMARQILAWRRSYGDRREQFKWLASGAVVCFASLLVSVLLSTSRGWWHAAGDVAVIGAAALPVSIGVAILKYRLYDIDRITSRIPGAPLHDLLDQAGAPAPGLTATVRRPG